MRDEFGGNKGGERESALLWFNGVFRSGVTTGNGGFALGRWSVFRARGRLPPTPALAMGVGRAVSSTKSAGL